MRGNIGTLQTNNTHAKALIENLANNPRVKDLTAASAAELQVSIAQIDCRIADLRCIEGKHLTTKILDNDDITNMQTIVKGCDPITTDRRYPAKSRLYMNIHRVCVCVFLSFGQRHRHWPSGL